MPACGTTERLHAQLVIGGPGLDGVVAAVGRMHETPMRAITGNVSRASNVAAAGVHVHAIDAAAATT